MCRITGTIIGLEANGYKVVAEKLDGRLYSPVTGVEYKREGPHLIQEVHEALALNSSPPSNVISLYVATDPYNHHFVKEMKGRTGVFVYEEDAERFLSSLRNSHRNWGKVSFFIYKVKVSSDHQLLSGYFDSSDIIAGGKLEILEKVDK